MTYKEKLEFKHPRLILPNGRCIGCPSDYGFDTKESEEANCRCNGGKGCDYCWDREIDEESLYPGIFVKNHPIARIDLKKAYDLETDVYSLNRTLMVEFLQREDDYLADAIIELAKKEGVNTLYLIDKEFILSALQHEMERRNNEAQNS